MNTDKKYVVLEHLLMPDRGFRFWCINSDDNTHLLDGRLAYKEVLFTNEENAAILASGQINLDTIPNLHDFEEFYRQKQEEEDNGN